MERIQQAFDNLKERLNNPFFISFLFSWVYWNWEITIALFWNNSSSSYQELIYFIESELNRCHSLWYPLISGLIYSLVLSPSFKILFKIVQNLVFRASEFLDIKLLKKGQVSLDKYLNFKEEYQKRSEVLENLIANESEKIHDLESKTTELFNLKEKFNTINAKYLLQESIVQKIHDVNQLNGKWIKISGAQSEDNLKEKFEIMGGNVYVKDQFRSMQRFTIRDFFYNESNRTLSFCLFRLDSNSLFALYQLNTTLKEMSGREYRDNQEYFVNFEREV